MTWAHAHSERVRFGDRDGCDHENGETVALPDALKKRLR